MSTFVGIGLGPIQTGIFLAGAARGGFDRIVIAEVNDALKTAVNAVHSVTVNIAGTDRVRQETYEGVEVFNPTNPVELEKLISAAADADEVATALPSVKFFTSSADWLRAGFARQPNRRRFVYTAENNNHAAEALAAAIGRQFPATFYLNTVIGKMSGVIPAAERVPLAPAAAVGHLVEEFNHIYISSCPGIEERKTVSLYVKPDLLPFEEAKLYGHNAVHFLLGMLGKSAGCAFMNELTDHPELLAKGRAAFIDESGAALCRKYATLNDELFTPSGYQSYADGLLTRMTNPFLRDAIDRVTRDPERKLGWDDRVVGTMRLALSQDIEPRHFSEGARLAAPELAGSPERLRQKLAELWPKPWNAEHERLFGLIG